MRRTTPLEVSEEDRTLLLSWLGSPRLSARIRLRARIVVASAGGQGARALARDLDVSLETIYLWRKRYTAQGIEGLRSLSSPGRRSQIDRRRAALILRAGRTRGAGTSGPSVAAVARASGVSRTTVRRLWDRHGLVVGSTHDQPEAPGAGDVGACDIVAIYIDPPWRLLARVVRSDRPRVTRSSAVRRTTRRWERASAASTLLTALEAFDADTWPRRGPTERGLARLGQILSRLAKMGGGDALEVLAGPGLRNNTNSPLADARSSGAAAIRVVRARTRGAWLARATDWLRAASGTQDATLGRVFGHLMDYFASWRDGGEPFVWTPSQPMVPRASKTAAPP